MGMKMARITYHLDRARAARADPRERTAGRRGARLVDIAARHEADAARLILEGLADYANLADNANARYQRRRTKRVHAGGPGRGHRRGSGWVAPGGRGGGFVREETLDD